MLDDLRDTHLDEVTKRLYIAPVAVERMAKRRLGKRDRLFIDFGFRSLHVLPQPLVARL